MNLFQVMISVFLIACSTEHNNNSSLIVDAFPNLNFEQPVDIQSPKDGTNRIFVLSQPGIVFVFDNDSKTKTKKVFLDIRDKVLYGGEQGLLGLAFHPNFKRMVSFILIIRLITQEELSFHDSGYLQKIHTKLIQEVKKYFLR